MSGVFRVQGVRSQTSLGLSGASGVTVGVGDAVAIECKTEPTPVIAAFNDVSLNGRDIYFANAHEVRDGDFRMHLQPAPATGGPPALCIQFMRGEGWVTCAEFSSEIDGAPSA